MAGYSKTRLINKIGIKEGMRGIFVHVPEEVEKLFESAPAFLPQNFLAILIISTFLQLVIGWPLLLCWNSDKLSLRLRR